MRGRIAFMRAGEFAVDQPFARKNIDPAHQHRHAVFDELRQQRYGKRRQIAGVRKVMAAAKTRSQSAAGLSTFGRAAWL